MAKIEQMDRQESDARKLALLALEANEAAGKGGSSCPTDSELASLLDGQCQGEERKRLQEHIAGCDDCRRRCLEVGMALMEINRSPRRSKARIYTWASAFLAAAACVVLFLSIDSTPPWQKRSNPHPVRRDYKGDEIRSDQARPAPGVHINSLQQKTVSPPQVRPEPDARRPGTAVYAKGDSELAQPAPSAERVMEAKKRIRPAGPAKSRQLPAAAIQDRGTGQELTGRKNKIMQANAVMEMNDKAGSQDSWLSRKKEWDLLLRQACARQEKSSIIWQALHGEGAALLQSAPQEERKSLQTLVSRMPLQDPKNSVDAFCTTLEHEPE